MRAAQSGQLAADSPRRPCPPHALQPWGRLRAPTSTTSTRVRRLIGVGHSESPLAVLAAIVAALASTAGYIGRTVSHQRADEWFSDGRTGLRRWGGEGGHGESRQGAESNEPVAHECDECGRGVIKSEAAQARCRPAVDSKWGSTPAPSGLADGGHAALAYSGVLPGVPGERGCLAGVGATLATTTAVKGCPSAQEESRVCSPRSCPPRAPGAFRSASTSACRRHAQVHARVLWQQPGGLPCRVQHQLWQAAG
jgi:hypothetical protein